MKKVNQGIKSRNQVQGFNVLENECIWMKTGIVNFRECDNDFDCNSCPFDKAMQKAMGPIDAQASLPERPQWVESLKKKYPGANRPCRHTLTGRINEPKICTMSYECYHCPFDQTLDQEDFATEIISPSQRSASGYRIADGYYYHMGHSWARFEHGGRVRIGMDDFIGKVFGPSDKLSLPPLGAKLKQNQAGLEFSRQGNAAAVLSPITGRVQAVNDKTRKDPEIVRQNPYDEGWLCIVEPDMPKRNLKSLFFGIESFQWMEKEVQLLAGLMGPEYENLAATGGAAMDDLFGMYPEIGWDRLLKAFLKTGG